MTSPLYNSLALRTAFYPAATAWLAGCSSAPISSFAAGAGLAALGFAAWEAYRRFSSLRNRIPSDTTAKPPAMVLRPPTVAPTTNALPRCEAAIGAYLQNRHPLLKESIYGPVTKAVTEKTIVAWQKAGFRGEALRPQIDHQLDRLHRDLRNFQHKNPVTRRLMEALNSLIPPTYEPDHGIPLADYLATYNEAIFDRWVTGEMVHLLGKPRLPLSLDIVVTLDRFIPKNEWIKTHLALLDSATERSLLEPKVREAVEQLIRRGYPQTCVFDVTTSFNAKGRNWLRKIYISPHFPILPDFVRLFVPMAAAENLPIFALKVHSGALKRQFSTNARWPGS